MKRRRAFPKMTSPRAERLACGLTIAEVAVAAGIPPSRLSAFEREQVTLSAEEEEARRRAIESFGAAAEAR